MIIICEYFLLFMLYAFLGWCLEVICKLVSDHKFINRGFLIGPYCPIYGYGAIIMTLLLKKYLDDPVTLFIMIILTCSILEYFTSYILEKLFATRWWDYSTYKFNINGRICLETMIPFGIFGLLLMYKVTPFFMNIINAIPNIWLITIACILFIIFLIDNIISFKIMNNIKSLNKETQAKKLIKKDDTEKITELVRKQLKTSKRKFHERLFKAYPHLQLLTLKKKKK